MLPSSFLSTAPITQQKETVETTDAGLAETVRLWITEQTSKFSSTDVRKYLRALKMEFQDASIRGLMKRLVDDGLVEVTKQGKGRRPTVFKRKERV